MRQSDMTKRQLGCLLGILVVLLIGLPIIIGTATAKPDSATVGNRQSAQSQEIERLIKKNAEKNRAKMKKQEKMRSEIGAGVHRKSEGRGKIAKTKDYMTILIRTIHDLSIGELQSYHNQGWELIACRSDIGLNYPAKYIFKKMDNSMEDKK